MKRITFKFKNKDVVEFFNQDRDHLGHLERIHVGQWMSWVYFLEHRCYLSAGCSDEVRDAQKVLNLHCKSGATPIHVNLIERKNK